MNKSALRLAGFWLSTVLLIGSADARDRENCKDANADRANRIRACTQWISVGGGPINEAYFFRGMLRAEQGLVDAAIADYTRALAGDPKSIGSLVNRGILYWRKKELRRALVDFNKAIAIEPRLTVAYSNRAMVLAEMYDFARARTDAVRALQIPPYGNNAENGRVQAATLLSKLDQESRRKQ